jgi:hypothetical protein
LKEQERVLKIINIVFIFILSISLQANEKSLIFNFGLIDQSMDMYSKKDLKISMGIWLTEVTKDIGDIHMQLYNKPKQAANDLAKGKIDYISAFPITFVKYFDTTKLQNGFTGRFGDFKKSRFVILTKKELADKSIQELHHVKVGIEKNDEIMHIYTELYIDYSKIVKYKHRNRVLLELFFSKLDVAIVPLRTYELACDLNPQIAHRIRILKVTKYTSDILGFYRKDIPKKKVDTIFEEGLRVFNTPKGKEMMSIYKIETLVHTELSELDNARELYNKYKKVKGKK